MTGIAVVASAQDAKFAEAVRAALQAAGLDASVLQSLPKAASPHVVLIWSAKLEADRAIDAQALIGLWSEDRLVIARRDETPLPLGLRDLPSLPPSSSAAEVCAAVPDLWTTTAGRPTDLDSQIQIGSMEDFDAAPKAAAATAIGPAGSQEVELEFWRAIKDGNDPEDFELYVQQFPNGVYAELARRKLAKLRGIAPEDAKSPGKRAPVGPILAAIIVVALAGGGAWYYFNKSSIEKQAALTSALETATKASQELQQAQARQLEALRALDQARAAEDAARKSGDVAKLKEAQEAVKRGEAEAAKQAEFVKLREAAATDVRKKARDAARDAKSAKVEPKQEAPAAPKQEVAVASKQEVAPKAEAKVETMAPEAKAPLDQSKMTRSQRERLADEEAARKALAATGRTPSAAGQAPVQVASSPPSEPASTDPQAKVAPNYDALYQQAIAMEQEGKAAESVRIYRRAARAGSGKAAKRLGDIYDKGVAGVSRDYAESLQWYETARQLGERIETAGSRGSGTPGPVPVVRESAKAAPVPAAKPAPVPEPVKAAEPAPAPVPSATPEPQKSAAPAPSPAPAPESKPGWFSMRGLLIALLVLGLIVWRRVRRREKAEARHAQRQSRATTIVPVLDEEAPARSVYKPSTAAPQSDATLFVSYSHKDRSRVEPIVSVIEEMGRRVWMDRSDITGQTGWAGQIVRAIRECRAVVLMASPNSYTSDQVVRELYLAMNHRKTIVPIEIEPAEMPDELQYILAPFQHHRLSAGETRTVLGRALAAV